MSFKMQANSKSWSVLKEIYMSMEFGSYLDQLLQ
jgi:hypothetical protein